MNASIAINTYACANTAGYAGFNGEVDVNECLSAPCKNGGTCKDSSNSTLAQSIAAVAYLCSNAAGFIGTHGETDVNECLSAPCQNGGTCLGEASRE